MPWEIGTRGGGRNMKRGYELISRTLLKRWLPLKTLCATTAHTHSPLSNDPLAIAAKGQLGVGGGGWGCVWNEIRSKYAFFFFASSTHSAECARGMSILDGRRLGREGGEGLRTGCERQDRFGLDLHIGWAVQTSKGERTQRCANSLVIAPGSFAGTVHIHIQPFSGPESAGSSHVVGQIFPSVGKRDALAFSCPFHKTNTT